MKTIFCLSLFILFFNVAVEAQIRPDPELSSKLSGKTKFQDIKSTIITYYNQKLKMLAATDSVEKKGIMRQLKMWNREFWMSENYLNSKGEAESPSKIIMQALEKRKTEQQAANSPQAQSENWVSEGPEYSDHGVGRIDRIAFHPTDQQIMYAGSPYGGLFKTINGGNYWTPVSPFVASLGVSGIAIHPTNPNIIYVLSGDGESRDGGIVNAYGYRSASNGIYRSNNAGDTWQKLNDFPDVTADTIYQGRQLLINPNNPDTIFAATSRGLYRSSNGGNNWIKITTNIDIRDIKFKPGNYSTLYVTGNNVFLKSTNAGQSFTSINITNLNLATRVSMAVTPANPNKVMLLAGNSNNQSLVGVYTSLNSGDSFSSTYNGTNIFNNYIGVNVLTGQVDYNSNIEISRTNENIVFVGGLVIWKSTNGGSAWNQVTAYWYSDGDNTHPYIHPDNHCLKINPVNNKLFCCNDGGIYASSNETTSWDYISNGLSTSQFYHFEVENDEGNTWGGCQDNGILQRVTGLQFEEYAGGDGYDVMTDNPSRAENGDGNDVYFSVNTNIYTDDGLGGYTLISTPNPKNYFFANLAMSPLEENVIYAGYQDTVWISITKGSIWLPVGNAPGNWCISPCPSNALRLYAGGNKPNARGGLKRCDDIGGSAWVDLTSTLKNAGYADSLKITDIEVDGVDDNKVFISVGGTLDTCKAFATIDGGTTWTNITYNLPNVPAFSLKQDETGGLYIGTSIGVYYKRNGINYWEPFYNGLPPVPVTQIELYANNNRMQISTFGRGIWSTAKYGGCTNNLTLSGQAVGRNYWEVSDNLSSSQDILNSPGTHIIHSAGNRITLTPGAHIHKGAKYNGKIQPCGGQVQF